MENDPAHTILVVWSHDTSFSESTVLVDLNLTPFLHKDDTAELVAVSDGRRRSLFFKVMPIESSSNAQISINQNVMLALGISPRSKVLVRTTSEEKSSADVVELHFKGVYLTRYDMYRLGKRITSHCLYVGERLQYLGGLVRFSVDAIYRNGVRKFSGYISPTTKLVFRSDSSRLLLFIQLSQEMWNLDETGDIIFHSVVNSFLPEMLNRWCRQGDHHLVSIILFSSVSSFHRKPILSAGELEAVANNFYRVVIDQVHISRWADIMRTLRLEFAAFRRDVMVNEHGELSGSILPSTKGNILEALSIATTFLSSKFVDRDLCRTSYQAIIVTPGSGVFDVDRAQLYQLSKIMLRREIGVELVCLSRPPLHVTPLFRAKDHNGVVLHHVPTWINVSFWNKPDSGSQWIPRFKLYDLQMMGIMEDQLKFISVRNLPKGPCSIRFMKNYDANVFKSSALLERQRNFAAAAAGQPASAALLRPSNCAAASGEAIVTSSRSVATVSLQVNAANAKSALNTLLKPYQSWIEQITNILNPVIPETPRLQLPQPDVSVASSEHRVVSLPSRPPLRREPPVSSSLVRHSENESSPLAKILSGTNAPNKRQTKSMKPAVLFARTHSDTLTDSHPSMWRILKNQSIVDHPSRVEAYGRWSNVYPPGRQLKAMSWHSLKSPASLPLTTEVFPTISQFKNEYKFHFYDLNLDASSLSAVKVLHEMLGLRLQMGFQIAVGDAVMHVEAQLPRGNPSMVLQLLDEASHVGSRIYMVREGLIHRLAIDTSGIINVQLYTWVETDKNLSTAKPFSRQGELKVKTKYDKKYHSIESTFMESKKTQQLNWNQLDQQLVGIEENSKSGNLYKIRSRYVLIPFQMLHLEEMNPEHTRLSNEETYVEGVGKVVATLMKNAQYEDSTEKYLPINFYTGKVHHLVGYVQRKGSGETNHNRLNTTISLNQLVLEMQGDHGISFKDYRWHQKLYRNAFIGHELVSWLITTFSDINSPEEAVNYGNKLMAQHVLRHADNRHPFLNGFFFYQLTPPYERPYWSQSIQKEEPEKMKVPITRKIVVNVDPKRLSDRPERIHVYIDQIHNPENAFHFRVEWLNATPRLIDDLFAGLARIASSYFLRLVQVPICEISQNEHHLPFRSLLKIKPLLNHKTLRSKHRFGHGKLFFHKFLLSQMGFIPEMPSKQEIIESNLDKNYHIEESFYVHPQYIHCSGCVLAQILPDGTFYLVANTIHLSRLSMSGSVATNIADIIQNSLAELCNNTELLEKLYHDAITNEFQQNKDN